ncbi:hypothetical protein U2I54_16320 [Bacillus pseudomycoides]|uniref:Uncharacterized protein n=1 Tax=Bacillus bingmayongensis TaxID=1150157 RepID=A0ABU5JZL8_9BACI|nr:hypothetical protein [Bacillus pseudomycoides]
MRQYVIYASRLAKGKDIKAVCCASKEQFQKGSNQEAQNIMLKLTERSEQVGQH